VTVVDVFAAAPAGPPFGTPDHDPVADIWARLHRPFDPVAVVAAITGLSVSAVTHLVGSAVAASPEADRLLDELPRTIRALATSVSSNHERCKGELRGPVLWSETMSARASSFGDPDLYVCMTPSRAYDVDENRVLVAALVAVRDAADAATAQAPQTEWGTATFRRLKRNGNDARRFVEHPSLQRVARTVPGGRALKRTRAGKKAKVYEPALAMLARAANPLAADEVRAWCDRRTRAQLRLLTGVLADLETAGLPVKPVRASHGRLETGPLAYRHPVLLGDRRTPSGITVAGLLLDVPDVLADDDRRRAAARMRARADGYDAVVVHDDEDRRRAAAEAMRRLAAGS
jgi:hypothetical protein